MNLKTLIVGVILIVVAVGLFFWVIGYKNRAVALREQYMACEKTVQTAHDNMWKTIKQKYDVGDQYKEGFIASVNAVVEGRKGGALFKTVNENMPGLTSDLYKEIMATIEGKRDMLKREMDTEVDVSRQYNTLIEQFPGSLFVGGSRIDPKIITSGRTNEAWSSGEDNDTSLKDKPIVPKQPATVKTTIEQ